MKLEVPYSETVHLRPLIKLRLNGSKSMLTLRTVLVDNGSEISIFPLDDLAEALGVDLYKRIENGKEKRIQWRGKAYPLWMGRVELELVDRSDVCCFRWMPEVGFSEVPLHYPVLGQHECLDWFHTDLRPADQRVDFRAVNPLIEMSEPRRPMLVP